jgi:uncharacterized UPF0146 family protein
MLFELFTYLTTRCPQYARHMDYLYEAIAMRGRYKRNRAAWQPHLVNSRRFILSSVEKCRNRQKVVVLGAGLLLDVPLEELSSLFREVVLVDIVFLPEVRKSVKRFNNVALVQHDVTNMAEKLYSNIFHGLRDLPESMLKVATIDQNTDLVISLNIMSQLWVMPRAYALKKLARIDEELVDDWCKQIVASHYAYLRSLSCAVCLIADHEYVKRDKEGKVVSQGSTIFDLVLPEPELSWTWNISPRNEESQYASKELVVGAWVFNMDDRECG